MVNHSRCCRKSTTWGGGRTKHAIVLPTCSSIYIYIYIPYVALRLVHLVLTGGGHAATGWTGRRSDPPIGVRGLNPVSEDRGPMPTPTPRYRTVLMAQRLGSAQLSRVGFLSPAPSRPVPSSYMIIGEETVMMITTIISGPHIAPARARPHAGLLPPFSHATFPWFLRPGLAGLGRVGGCMYVCMYTLLEYLSGVKA